MDMLRDALDNARANYLRDISYADLMVGGLKAVRALLTTDGLDRAFPALADDVKRRQFLDVVEEHLVSLNNNAFADRAAMQKLLTRLQTVNAQTIGLPDEVLVSEFADGAFSELDPFTGVIWPSEVEEFNKSTQGEFSGVGIQIQSDPDGSLKVVSPLEDSPAFRARIRAGDVITHIDGKNAKGITTTQAVKIITGPPGTEVTLTIRSPDGATRDVPLVRQTIKVASLKGWRHLPGGGWEYLVDPENKIGYLRLTNFSKETAGELQRALEELNNAGARGVVLDLRYNPGGLLTAAADVSDAFLREGAIVSTRSDRPEDRNHPVLNARRQRTDSDVPLVVLVNQYSASASEIVSGALKDHKRAVIVGERTFGKGSVQMLFPLANRAAYLKLTTSHYFLPSGRCIHREENSTVWGVDPDVVVEMTPEQMRTAIDARSELDVLHDDAQDDGDQARRTEKAAMTLLDSDPQLNAALLLLRMHLAGAPLL
jgi:carboxyl-terminal processing protease